jgi:DNA-binding MurR/RpiR family transcriptional regulator
MRTKLAGNALDRIGQLGGNLSPKQQKLANFIFENSLQSSFLNSTSLAKEAGVSESTVVRLANSLGYPGFPEMQTSLREIAQKQISTLETFPLNGDSNLPLHKKVFNLEIALLKETADSITQETFEKAVDLLHRAKRVLVLGIQPSHPVASYFSFFLGILRPDVSLVTDIDLELLNAIKDKEKNCVVVSFSFPRYPRKTQEALDFLSGRGVSIIGITDTPLSPIAQYCNVLLTIKMKFITFIDPQASAMALLHALLTSFYLKRPLLSKKHLGNYEDIISKDNYYVRQDLNIVDLL